MSEREQDVSAGCIRWLTNRSCLKTPTKHPRPEHCAALLAALADAALLDALERLGAALLPVEGNIMPPGTWCVDPPGAETDDDVWMGRGVRGALRAAFTDTTETRA